MFLLKEITVQTTSPDYRTAYDVLKYWEEQWNTYLDIWKRLEHFYAPLWQRRPNHRSSIKVHDARFDEFRRLMKSVKRGRAPGEYTGAAMTLERARRAAKASGDRNPIHLTKPHPLFEGLIAHGMDGATQALAALKQELEGTTLVPNKVEIEFLSPVFLDDDKLHRIIITEPESGNPHLRSIEVWAESKKSGKERIVIRLTAHLIEDGEFADEDWLCVFVSAWRISALLAKAWKECLYVKQVLHFDHPGQRPLNIEVSAQAKELTEKGHLKVKTVSHGGRAHRPIAHGEATIIPKRKKRKV